ncbi:VCBS repeat-containing protein [bacterium]|nr:VCBS repeat-containing protein [bacterium]
MPWRKTMNLLYTTLIPFLIAAFAMPGFCNENWERHTIDDSSRGADGVRLGDLNHDGFQDIATGWEEGGRIRVYLNPGPDEVKQKWPAVTVGKVKAPEDAVFANLNSDNILDVVSCCEGNEKTIWFHWAPKAMEALLNPSAWQSQALAPSINRQRWMFCVPLQVDGKNGVDLVVGGKHPHAQVGWFQAPPNPQNINKWQWHSLYDASWIMSILLEDMDKDGDEDIVFSDRKDPKTRGCFWLENPGSAKSESEWPLHKISQSDREFMFMTVDDLDGDGLKDVLVSAKRQKILYYRQTQNQWVEHSIPMPKSSGTAKAVRVRDVNMDGKNDLIFTCEHADNKPGIMWLSYKTSPTDSQWQAHDIGGKLGTKYDLIELLDLDNDKDVDIITCEERDNLGVIWYENPTR